MAKPKTPMSERFWSKVNKTEGCWEWIGSTASGGYGRIQHDDGRIVRAHRASWELHHGEAPPEGLDVCHTCDNRKCVRPDHLFWGTRKDNIQDMVRKGRHASTVHRATAPTCKRGHQNWSVSGRQRYCLTCHAMRQRRRRGADPNLATT